MLYGTMPCRVSTLAAGIDRRVGAKTARSAFRKWTDVEAAYDHWAKQLATRLNELRGNR